MGFYDRLEFHDHVLKQVLPRRLELLGIEFIQQGYEATVARDGLVISSLEDIGAHALRFRPDGVVQTPRGIYLVELKTKLKEQTSPNYDFEMAPWEKGYTLHNEGNLVIYIFWPAERVCWIDDTKPDWIGVPSWRWSKQDYLRIKARYESMSPVHYKDNVKKGSGTVFGLISYERIKAMLTFDQFWLEVLGKWQNPKQLKFL